MGEGCRDIRGPFSYSGFRVSGSGLRGVWFPIFWSSHARRAKPKTQAQSRKPEQQTLEPQALFLRALNPKLNPILIIKAFTLEPLQGDPWPLPKALTMDLLCHGAFEQLLSVVSSYLRGAKPKPQSPERINPETNTLVPKL